MTNIIIQISKYIIILLMAAYTFSCFSIFTRNYEDEEKRVLIRQDVLLFLLQMVSFFAMYTAKKDLRILFIYAALAVVILGVILLYNLIYPSVSRLVVNNMCMLITIGFIMLTRISYDQSMKQFKIHCCKAACFCYCRSFFRTDRTGIDPQDGIS